MPEGHLSAYNQVNCSRLNKRFRLCLHCFGFCRDRPIIVECLFHCSFSFISCLLFQCYIITYYRISQYYHILSHVSYLHSTLTVSRKAIYAFFSHKWKSWNRPRRRWCIVLFSFLWRQPRECLTIHFCKTFGRLTTRLMAQLKRAWLRVGRTVQDRLNFVDLFCRLQGWNCCHPDSPR